MAVVRKFSFDQVFDSVPPATQDEPANEPPQPEPVFTESDLASARSEGYAEGREAGAADARDSMEQAAAAALQRIGDQLAGLAPVARDSAQRCRDDAVGIAHAITRKMVEPATLDSVLAEVESVISRILPRIIDEPRIVIRVSDTLLDALQPRLTGMAESCGFPGSMILLSEHGLQCPDCRIEWSDGGAEHDTRQLWDEIDDIIDRYRAEIRAGDGVPEPSGNEATRPEQIKPEEHADG